MKTNNETENNFDESISDSIPESENKSNDKPARKSKKLDSDVKPDSNITVETKETFEDLGLSASLVATLKKKGYIHPTPIQCKVIPLILQNSDILASAPTGTGKTASFALPIIDILSSGTSKAKMPRALIVEPTRELAVQVTKNFDAYGNNLFKVVSLIGGESSFLQQKALNRPVDALIVTPGRFLDLYDQGKIMLNNIKIVVIDEIDQMMDIGFLPHVKRIMKLLPASKQTLFFSATMPTEIRNLSKDFLNNHKEVKIEAGNRLNPIEHYLVNVPPSREVTLEENKYEILERILHQHQINRALIFCNRKKDIALLSRMMKDQRMTVDVLHGDLSQSQRNKSLERFKQERVDFLIASNVAARGIDVSGLPCVVNFEVPLNNDDYTHRIGRTGRAGLPGKAFTFYTDKEGKLVQRLVEKFNYTIPFLDGKTLTAIVPDIRALGARGVSDRRSGPRGGKPSSRPRFGRTGQPSSNEGAPRPWMNSEGGPRQRPSADGAPRYRTSSEGAPRSRTDNEGAPRHRSSADGAPKTRTGESSFAKSKKPFRRSPN